MNVKTRYASNKNRSDIISRYYTNGAGQSILLEVNRSPLSKETQGNRDN